ncbi:MAG: SBBP repeat-containing protein, partial [Crocinitomicaceae bacterium]|nr:SBBP repeat-containing protein [Crocinitomicaceae bacterium]
MKNINIMSSILVLLTCGSVLAQENEFLWAHSQGSADNDFGRAITVDDNGDIYTTGRFSGTVDFDGSMMDTFLMVSSGAGDIYITKTTSEGNFIWAKQIGGETPRDNGTVITADASGVYIGGVFKGDDVDFDPDPDPSATELLTSESSGVDAFILKLDLNGDFIWATRYGGDGDDSPLDFALDGMGSLYLVGFINGSDNQEIEFVPAAIGTSISFQASANNDALAAKMDTAGNFIWAINFNAQDNCKLNGLTLDSNGHPIVVGLYGGQMIINPTTVISSYDDSPDILYAKLDETGDLVWLQNYGSASYDQGQSVVCDEDDNIYVTGGFSESIAFTPSNTLTSQGMRDCYIHKLSSTGDFIWVKRIGGTANTFATDLNIDPFGYLYISGTTIGNSTDYNPGLGSDTTAYFGSKDIFIDKLDLDGNFIWVKAFGSEQNDQIYQSYVDNDGNFYTTGAYKDTIDFNYGTGVNYLNSTTTTTNAFVFKLETSCNTVISSTQDVQSCGEPYTWSVNDSTYSSSGVHSLVFSSMYGCDSTVT